MNDECIMLEALKMEWRLAWWCLPEEYRRRMRVPGFEVREMESRWGAWYGDRRLLVLNSRLMTAATWPCIREVLRHEMAHQLSDEVLHSGQESHGDQFRDAC
ncbi:MAG: SprT-like domain-containing protein, partial [bacterium]